METDFTVTDTASTSAAVESWLGDVINEGDSQNGASGKEARHLVGPDAAFSTFKSSRISILERLDAIRLGLDQWLDDHDTGETGVVELGRLEGLLEERRRRLTQLLKLDDDLLDHLVGALGKVKPKPKNR